MDKERESREKIKDTFMHIYSDILNAMVIKLKPKEFKAS
jgi:hypothetical protein